MDEAKANGIGKAFVVFHYPVFARSGLGPIPAPDNPHKLIASYAKDMEVVVLNGHVHTTEIYDVDGVKYLMLGGGGAEQDPILPGRTSIKVPADYPPDLYWKGQPPQENTTTSSSMSNPTRRRSSPSIASGHGRQSHSELKNSSCDRERAISGSEALATILLIIHGLVAVALLGALTHQTLAAWVSADARPGSFFGRFRSVPSARSLTPWSFYMQPPRC